LASERSRAGVCCDIDVRFLAESDRANLEVRALDVRSDPIEPGQPEDT
jgi:hypothetical protein